MLLLYYSLYTHLPVASRKRQRARLLASSYCCQPPRRHELLRLPPVINAEGASGAYKKADDVHEDVE